MAPCAWIDDIPVPHQAVAVQINDGQCRVEGPGLVADLVELLAINLVHAAFDISRRDAEKASNRYTEQGKRYPDTFAHLSALAHQGYKVMRWNVTLCCMAFARYFFPASAVKDWHHRVATWRGGDFRQLDPVGKRQE